MCLYNDQFILSKQKRVMRYITHLLEVYVTVVGTEHAFKYKPLVSLECVILYKIKLQKGTINHVWAG